MKKLVNIIRITTESMEADVICKRSEKLLDPGRSEALLSRFQNDSQVACPQNRCGFAALPNAFMCSERSGVLSVSKDKFRIGIHGNQE